MQQTPQQKYRAWFAGNGYLPLMLTALVVAVLLAGLAVVTMLENKRFQEAEHRETIYQLSGIRSAMEGAINANLQLTHGLVAQVAVNPEISSAEFDRLAQELLRNNTHIRNIGLAPNNVIAYMYPRAGNEAAIGFSYLDNKKQRDAVLRAIDSGQTIVAGPVALVQGGAGFISRTPVWEAPQAGEDERGPYWGIVSVVMNRDSLYEAAGLITPDLNIEIAIRGADGLGADGAVFYGEPTLFDQHPVLLDVSLDGGSWQLAATPHDGWASASPYLWRLRIAGLILILTVGGLLFQTLRGQQRILDQERSFKRLFIGHGAVMCLIDPEDLAMVDVNPAAERYYGHSRPALLDMRFSDLTTVVAAALTEKLSQSLDGNGIELHLGQRLADGRIREAEVHVSVIVTTEGRQLYFAIVHDITDRLQAERSLRDAMQAAQQADRAKGEFLANISHEIRTPMNAIIGMGHQLAQTELSDPQRDCVAILHSSSRRLLGLIDDILDFSRISAGKSRLESVPFRLTDVFGDLANLLGAEAAKKGIELRFSRAETIPEWLSGDPLRLGQILTNLTGNAVKFTEGGGEIQVTVEVARRRPDGIWLRFRVRDTGLGISTEEQGKLFKPFSQVDASTTRRHGGSGLGLAISRQLVEMMGGEISVESAPGKGSTFTFTARLGLADGHHELPASSPDESVAGLQGAQVLLVEDDETNRLVVRSLLERRGVKLTIAENGRSALAALEETTFDAVLMDVQMPELDGFGATTEIRNDPRFANLPIVALTAHALPGERERCVAAGMDDYLAKPIDPVQLSRTLGKWIRTKHKGNGDLTAEAAPIESEPASLPPAIAGIEIAEGLLSLGGNADLYRRTLVKFREQHQHTVQILRETLHVGDTAGAAQLAHKLAGGSGTLGAKGVYLAARELEHSLDADDTRDPEELVRRLDAALAKVLVSLTVLEHTPGDLSKSQGPDSGARSKAIDGE